MLSLSKHGELPRPVVAIALGALFALVAACADRGETPFPASPEGPPAEEGPSFAQDVLPIFLQSCAFSGCHDAATRRQGLVLDSYEGLLRGSARGGVVIPGDAENSRIIKRLEGRETPRMPLGRASLPQEQIGLIRAWVDAGAREN